MPRSAANPARCLCHAVPVRLAPFARAAFIQFVLILRLFAFCLIVFCAPPLFGGGVCVCCELTVFSLRWAAGAAVSGFIRCAAYGRRPLPLRITHNRHRQHAAARLHMRPAVRALLQTARLRNLAAPCTSELSYTKRTANAGSLPLGLHRLRPCAFYLPAGPNFLLPWPVYGDARSAWRCTNPAFAAAYGPFYAGAYSQNKTICKKYSSIYV